MKQMSSSEFEPEQVNRLQYYHDIATLQSSRFLSYRQFSIAYDVAVATVQKWVGQGILPVEYPFGKGAPRINMKKFFADHGKRHGSKNKSDQKHEKITKGQVDLLISEHLAKHDIEEMKTSKMGSHQ